MDYLKELCQDLHIDSPLEKSERGGYLLPINSSLVLEVTPMDPGVAFFSKVTPCPEVKKEELFLKLMKANLFGQGTLGAALGLDPQENCLTLSSTFAYDMDYRDFKGAVEDFANGVDYWRVEVDEHVKLAKGGIL
jgi:hypothetical protein